MSRERKLRRRRRKLVARSMAVLRVNLLAVAQQTMKDLVWNATPEERTICVEAMLHLIAREFEQWPDDWRHKHYMWPDGQCSCGHRIDVVFDGVTPVDGTTLESHVYRLTRDLKINTLTVARDATVYFAPWRLEYRRLTKGGGRIIHSPSVHAAFGPRMFGDIGQIMEVRNMPLWDSIVRVTSHDENGNPIGDGETRDLSSMLEMGPRQR